MLWASASERGRELHAHWHGSQAKEYVYLNDPISSCVQSQLPNLLPPLEILNVSSYLVTVNS